MDVGKVARCRALADEIAGDVQRYIDRHTTVGVERAILRAYGADGVDDKGVPLVNTAVDRYRTAGVLDRGIAFHLGRALVAGARDVQDAAERLAFAPGVDSGEGGDRAAVEAALEGPTREALARIDRAREDRDARRHRAPPGPAPLKYVIVATGNIHDDALQAKAAAHAGADIVAIIRATAQSLLDYVPHGATTEGYGGTFATQENFRIIRRALDEASERQGRYVMQTNYSSGLCMTEIAWMAAVERLDMLLNDAMYGILFRDINMCRTFVDQYVSRRFIARAGIVINTGEDNYLTTADAVEKAHTVLASQFINEAFALRAGLKPEQIGLGHAYEIDPWLEDSFLLEVAQAQLIRQIFDRHPIKWMPPTKHKTGRHLPVARARRDVRPRGGHDEAIDRALGDVQRGGPEPASDGPLPRAQGHAVRPRRLPAPRRRDRVQVRRNRRAASRARPRRGLLPARGRPQRLNLGGHRARSVRRREARAYRRARATRG